MSYRPPSATSSNNDSANYGTAPNTPLPNSPNPLDRPQFTEQQSYATAREDIGNYGHANGAYDPVNGGAHSQPLLTPGTPGTPAGAHTPLPYQDNALEPPRALYLDETPIDSPRDSYASNPINSTAFLGGAGVTEKNDESYPPASSGLAGKKRGRRPLFITLGALAALIVVAAAVVLPVYFLVIKPKHGSSSGGAAGTSGSGNPGSPSGATSGGDGSLVKTDDGSTFKYNNTFGGFWVSDPSQPFNDNAQPNSWTKPLNQSWDFGTDRINGVNLGGLFVLEPFITPAFFQKYQGTVDEWTLSQAMSADSASGGLSQLEDHYNTFITEMDIAQIAGAGLNWIRLPIPFWAIDAWDGEPFLQKTSWKYILRVLGWARKYGLRVNLDLHTCPGSQNGYNHSGRLGSVNFLNGVMGVANAERMLNYIRILTEFISQPEYANVVPMFGIVNEALVETIGKDQITSFYILAHDMIRGITGIGEGKGPYISIHDGFQGTGNWAGYLPGADRLILDTHPYFAFDGQPNNSPIVADDGHGSPGGVWPMQACQAWGPGMNTSKAAFGITIAGEFSNGYNDCGTFVRGVGNPASYGGDCGFFQDSSQWNETVKQGLQSFALASMDALQDWFFWTWKIGPAQSGHVEAPLWSYQAGLDGGWMPTDPRTARGMCGSLGVQGPQFPGTYSAWQTGGSGAGTIAPSATAGFAFPPSSLNGAAGPASALPTYAATGSIETMPPATLTDAPKTVSTPDGWFDKSDTTSGVTSVAGCTYPDAWSAVGVAVPTPCGSGNAARALMTPSPARR